MNPRRLYRSRTDRVLTGIAGGMAEYLEVDPTIVRILWVLGAIFTGGLVLLLYIVLAFVIQVNPFQGGPIPAGAWGAGYAPGAPGQTGWAQPAGATGAAPAAPAGTAYAMGSAAGGALAAGHGAGPAFVFAGAAGLAAAMLALRCETTESPVADASAA